MKKTVITLTALLIYTSFVSGHEDEKSKEEDNKIKILSVHKILWKMREGDRKVLRTLPYVRLQYLNEFIMRTALEQRISYFDALWLRDPIRWQENICRSVAGGLFNKDPQVRLFLAHLLLKLGPKRSWIEDDIQRALDPRGLDRETVNRRYIYTDCYGRVSSENLKQSLIRLSEVGSRIILMSPRANLRSYQSRAYTFEWSAVLGATSYELYVNNRMYYLGPKSMILVNSRLSYGGHRWQVVAKDREGRFITSSEGLFYINQMRAPNLRLVSGYLNDLPRFQWNRVRGARYYELVLYSEIRGRVQRRVLYRGKNTRFHSMRNLAEGRHRYVLWAKNVYQKASGKEYVLIVSTKEGKKVVTEEEDVEDEDYERRKKEKGEKLIPPRDYKNIEKENEKELEEELEFDVKDFKE